MLHLNTDQLIHLLRDFSTLTKIKICVFDDEGNEVAYYPERLCEFCHYLRTSERADRTCRASDENAFLFCRKTGKPYIYTCHMGLTECVSPILCEGNCIGFLMLGQTLPAVRSDFDSIRSAIEDYGLDVSRAKSLYAALPDVPLERARAALSVLEACAGYLYFKKLVVKEEDLSLRVAAYVSEHLSEPLSVDGLCSAFRLSRVELYELFRARFSCSPGEYLRTRRLQRAADLLAHTRRPVAAIAADCGFSDYNYFSKVFKRRNGISPRAYRNCASPQ